MFLPPFAKFLNIDKNFIFILYKILSIKVILSANQNTTILKQILTNIAVIWKFCNNIRLVTRQNYPYRCPNKQRTSIACKCACLSCARADRYAYYVLQYICTYGTYYARFCLLPSAALPLIFIIITISS